MRTRLVVELALTLCISITTSHSAVGSGAAVSDGARPEMQTELRKLEQRVARLEAQNQEILERVSRLAALLRSQEPAGRQTRSSIADNSLQSRVSETPKTPVTLAGTGPQGKRDTASVTIEGNGSRLSFYGFVRVDAITDDSRPNSIQTPTFIRFEDPGRGRSGDGDFAFHPRLTRLGLNYRGPVLDGLGGARISGKVETDFQNGGRESRAVARYRHTYMKLTWDSSSLLLGQTWDIISPLYPTVNNDTMMWNAGNLGDRRMQLRYTYEPRSGFSLRAGLALSGAVDAQDLDRNGVRDGEDSGTPQLQARIGYNSPGNRARVGFWGHFARESTEIPIAGENDFQSHSYGFDYDFKLNSVVSLKGEAWRGANLSDLRGGIGQGINPQTGVEIDSRGGWVELGLKASKHYSFSAGFTIDDPENQDLSSGGRTENRVWYVTNRFRIAAPFMIGLDYLYWRTDFKELHKGTDNRLNLYFLYNF